MRTEAFFRAQEIDAEPAHVAGVVASVEAMLRATAAAFASLPLEAEPSHFESEQRRQAP